MEGAEYTILDGNNVNAYHHLNFSTFVNTEYEVSLSCDFAVNLSQEPDTYTNAASTNLFYWNNIIHDIQYHYGFDEPAGNFQTYNYYGNGGADNDHVHAESQDYAGNCNANFLTPPDGSIPRMQMYLCNNTTPERDGDFDNAVIVHEYGHGISNRQVGGPNNVSCLGNAQQPGEGWSDWLGLAYTAESTHTAGLARGMGTYLFGQAANGPGIRPAPYSTNTSVNNYQYDDIGGLIAPHGVGFVWATILWEGYWELVSAHGFSADLYNALGNSGNQRMMLYVNEGLKNTACSPTFPEARDGIIQAAVDNHGGEDVCRLWDAFARRGLGSDASTTGSNSSATNGFAVPAECGACVPAGVVETACHDGIDNDCDGSKDCADSDCVGGPAETACDDGIDNDCNGPADCADSACQTGSEASCDDGVDNDCDGFTDCADTVDCDLAPACAQNCTLGEQGDPCVDDLNCCSNKCRGNGAKRSCKGDFTCTPTEDPEKTCTGGFDEDCDGLTDCDDPDCSGDSSCKTLCLPVPDPCVRDSDCCSNNCSNGKPERRKCQAP